MERFATAIVAGGIALVAGLWIVTLLAAPAPGWFLGVGLAAVGLASLGWGIWSQVAVDVPLE